MHRILHNWLPKGLLILGGVLLTLKVCLWIFIEYSIGGGLAHMGMNPLAIPVYSIGVALLICLWIYYRPTERMSESPAQQWLRTALLSLAGLLAIVAALREFIPVYIPTG